MHDGVIYMALSERNYPIKLANSYLEELHAGFQQVIEKNKANRAIIFIFQGSEKSLWNISRLQIKD